MSAAKEAAPKVVVVTGASGLLGRAVTAAFTKRGDAVIPLAFTRADSDKRYTKLDLTDTAAVEAFFDKTKVDVVVHAAAERRPDVAEANPAAAERINVATSAHLGELAKKHGFTLLYISTDYVFSGRAPPYEVHHTPDPLQMYGRQKLAGEEAVVASREGGANSASLRVPVLFGRAEYNAESAVNVLVDVVKDQSGKTYTMDHYQIRNPTNVDDVARVLYDLAHLTRPLPPILHFRSTGPQMTKWEMTQVIARALDLPLDHVTPVSAKPETKPGQTERPWNTELSVAALEELGVSTAEEKPFTQWWPEYLAAEHK
ncbi:Methionine adenosyltransferase 2 subunit beta [Vanrija pseudolonga]|uniref:Methionine adenosyltransferase 2 subunit beta n=1 Tax=Vanrija pseudolonga TaxID=143232 RepID=A0AAF0YET7_9TREE|nr:Methionine adenosyltransferase 2 subunit beta [Vanrija pseudolonga]